MKSGGVGGTFNDDEPAGEATRTWGECDAYKVMIAAGTVVELPGQVPFAVVDDLCHPGSQPPAPSVKHHHMLNVCSSL